MANHKRGRPKNSRGGCLMCKPWKVNGSSDNHQLRPNERKKIQLTDDDLSTEDAPESMFSQQPEETQDEVDDMEYFRACLWGTLKTDGM